MENLLFSGVPILKHIRVYSVKLLYDFQKLYLQDILGISAENQRPWI